MKRRDLLRVIERRALMMEIEVTFREGGRHTIITVGSRVSIIPRHREIHSGTVDAIMKDLEPIFGKRWLKK
jgi:hypothetical protein